MVPKPWWFGCAHCEALALELQDAWHADQQELRARFEDTAQSAGREPEAFLLPWIESLAQMPDAEFDTRQAARYPRVADVRLKWKEHESVSSHPSLGNGWRATFIFHAVTSGYGNFLKRRQGEE
jgi:hypothetical protein